MSSHKVPLTTITDIIPHGNADSLEVAVVYGFHVVVRKGSYSVGLPVIYIPIDSVIPANLETELFPTGSKIKLTKGRVKQIRIRGRASQGMLVTTQDIAKVYGVLACKLEKDYAEELSIIKYEPPEAEFTPTSIGTKKVKRQENPHFDKYNGLENIKWMPDLFKDGESVVFTEKLHGTNARCGILPYEARTLWEKILKFFNKLPTHQHCYGSNNVQLQDKSGYKGYYGTDVYGTVLNKINAFKKLLPGEQIFGEIYGEGIQKGYTYGCTSGEQRFALFDVKVDGEFLTFDQVRLFADARGFDVVPELYRGPFSQNILRQYVDGASVMPGAKEIREGIVIKPIDNKGQKRYLKAISEKYLDKDQSDFH